MNMNENMNMNMNEKKLEVLKSPAGEKLMPISILGRVAGQPAYIVGNLLKKEAKRAGFQDGFKMMMIPGGKKPQYCINICGLEAVKTSLGDKLPDDVYNYAKALLVETVEQTPLNESLAEQVQLCEKSDAVNENSNATNDSHDSQIDMSGLEFMQGILDICAQHKALLDEKEHSKIDAGFVEKINLEKAELEKKIEFLTQEIQSKTQEIESKNVRERELLDKISELENKNKSLAEAHNSISSAATGIKQYIMQMRSN